MDKFFTDLSKRPSPSPSTQPTQPTPPPSPSDPNPPKNNLPKGVILDKDGKPCRNCTSFASWAAQTASSTASLPSPPAVTYATTPQPPLPLDPTTHHPCPPDVTLLGTHTWTFLHALSATYPPHATASQQGEMRSFLTLFANLYPCGTCAGELREWMRKEGNRPRVGGREELGRWMCEAHNGVNVRLGKGVFDCAMWERRWRTGCGGEE